MIIDLHGIRHVVRVKQSKRSLGARVSGGLRGVRKREEEKRGRNRQKKKEKRGKKKEKSRKKKEEKKSR